jgi:hypothetical protein
MIQMPEATLIRTVPAFQSRRSPTQAALVRLATIDLVVAQKRLCGTYTLALPD